MRETSARVFYCASETDVFEAKQLVFKIGEINGLSTYLLRIYLYYLVISSEWLTIVLGT